MTKHCWHHLIDKEHRALPRAFVTATACRKRAWAKGKHSWANGLGFPPAINPLESSGLAWLSEEKFRAQFLLPRCFMWSNQVTSHVTYGITAQFAGLDTQGVGMHLRKRFSFLFRRNVYLDAMEHAAFIHGFPSLDTNNSSVDVLFLS